MIFLLLSAMVHATDLPEWSFETGDAGFVAESGLQWQWGLNSDAQWGWTTRLEGLYLNDATDRLIVPAFDLMGTVRPVLRLQHAYDIDQTGDGDAGWLEVYLDDVWVPIEPVYRYPSAGGFTGTSVGLVSDWFDLSTVGRTPQLRFVFSSDDAVRRGGWFIENVKIDDGDPVPPLIQGASELPDTTDIIGPYPLTASIIDDMNIAWADVHWTTNSGASSSSPMVDTGASTFAGLIAGQDPGTVVSWWIEASDGNNLSRWPETGAEQFSVRLPAPRDVGAVGELPNGRVADTHLDIEWSAPTSDYDIAGYVVERDGIQIETPDTETTTIRLIDGIQQVTVRGIFHVEGEQFVGDASPPFTVDVSLPSFHMIEPSHAWPGDFLRITVSGDNLYLNAERSMLDPGTGVTVENFEVVDANTARCLIHIDSETTPGTRTFILENGANEIESSANFLIRSAGERPVVLGAHPTSVRQGARTTIFLDMSAPADVSKPPPLVDFGEGIIVEEVTRRNTGLNVRLSVAYDAPLGRRSIEVDEGDRIITGASVDVRDTPKVPGSNCSLVAGKSDSSAWLCGFILLFLRRRKENELSCVRPVE